MFSHWKTFCDSYQCVSTAGTKWCKTRRWYSVHCGLQGYSKPSWLRLSSHPQLPSSLCLGCKAALMHLFLASLMPSLLAALKSTSELVHSEVCLLSALAALHKVVETLPHFISPYLEGLLIQVGFGQLRFATQGGKGNSFTLSVPLLALYSPPFDMTDVILVSVCWTCISFFFHCPFCFIMELTGRIPFSVGWLCFSVVQNVLLLFTSDLWEWPTVTFGNQYALVLMGTLS